MNELIPLQYKGNNVRMVMGEDGAPWWVAKDVCDVLGIGNSSMTLERLDDDEKGVNSIDTLGGPQQCAFVNEPGLYSLILGSRKPEAKEFKRWVTHEVLPSIRKTGGYQKPQAFSLVQQVEFFLACAKRQEEQDRKLATSMEIAVSAERTAQAAMAKVECNYGKFSVLGYWRKRGRNLSVQVASQHGRALTKICNDLGSPIENVADPRFGYVHIYPEGILEQYFEEIDGDADDARPAEGA
jgi:prophage antirepressor-like protein